jgi:DNA-binding FrmR family transcriptional regulator
MENDSTIAIPKQDLLNLYRAAKSVLVQTERLLLREHLTECSETARISITVIK